MTLLKLCDIIVSQLMSETRNKPTPKEPSESLAKKYQQRNREQILSKLKQQSDRLNHTHDSANSFAIQSDFDTLESFNQAVEHLAQAELISNVLIPIKNNISFIKAGTGSGKTHVVLEAIKNRVILTNPNTKAVIATPTRAMAMDIQNTGNMHVANDEDGDFVGLWIGGEGGKQINTSDTAVAVTGGKLWDLLMRKPTLDWVQTLVIDEADAMDARAIPAIKWLSIVRPDMNIIFVSATLNIEEFKQIYQPHPEASYIAPDHERPRPISVDYVDETTLSNLGLTGFKKASSYTNAPFFVLDSWMFGTDSSIAMENKKRGITIQNEYPLLQSGESVIIFMPTISSVNNLAKSLTKTYGEKVEVRALHSKISFEEMDKRLYDEIQDDKIGVFVCTDIVGRGVNFPDKFNINRAIDTGLRNRPQYDPITGRESLKVDVGGLSDVMQGLGRAGRNANDFRDVVGFVMQPKVNLYNGVKNEMVSNDPTSLILESAGFVKSIQSQQNIPEKYKPSSLVDYLKTLDTNPQTSKQFEAKLNSSLNRLYGIQALDKDNNVTKFGEFLIKMKLPVDFGILLFESLNSPYLPKMVQIINLLDNLDYFITRNPDSKPNYNKLVGCFKSNHSNLTSDLQFYAKLLEYSQPHYSLLNRKDTFNIQNRPKIKIDHQNAVQALFNVDDIDGVMEYVFKHDCGDEIGINLETIADAFKNQERVYESLDQQRIEYGDVLVGSETFEQTLKRLSLCAFPASIMQFQARDRRGILKYEHLASGKTVYVTKESEVLWGDVTTPEYITCASSRLDGYSGNYYVSGVQPVSLSDLTSVEKYSNWIVKKDHLIGVQASFNPQDGTSKGIVNTTFQDYTKHTTKVLTYDTVDIDSTTNPEIIYSQMKTYLMENMKSLDEHYKNNFDQCEYYCQLSQIADHKKTPISITKQPQELLTHHYATKLAALPAITQLDQFQSAILDGTLDLSFGIEEYLDDADYNVIDSLLQAYPRTVDEYTIKYAVYNDEIIAYFPKDKALLYQLEKSNDIEKITNTIKLNPKVQTMHNHSYFEDFTTQIDILVRDDLRWMRDKFVQGLDIPQFNDIKTDSDLEKIKPYEYGTHPLTDELVICYPSISADSWGRRTFNWSDEKKSDITTDSNYHEILKQITAEKNLEKLKVSFNEDLASRKTLLDEVVDKLNRSNDLRQLDQIMTIYNGLCNLYEGKVNAKTVQDMQELDDMFAKVNTVKYYGDEAKLKLQSEIDAVQRLYPDGKVYEAYEIDDQRSSTPVSLYIDGKKAVEIQLSYDRYNQNYWLSYDYNSLYSSFLEHPKCSDISTEVRHFLKSDEDINEYHSLNEEAVQDLATSLATQNVREGAWGYGDFVVDRVKRDKLCENIIKQLISKIELTDTQNKQLREFISYGTMPIYTSGKVVEFYNQKAEKWEQHLNIVRLSSSSIQPETKEKYYFNLFVAKDDNINGSKKIIAQNLTPTQSIKVFLISGDVELQPPFPLTENESMQNSPEQSVIDNTETADLLAQMQAKFGKKGNKR